MGKIGCLRRAELELELLRRPQVVIVEKGDPRGRGRPNSLVPRRARTAAVRPLKHPEPRIGERLERLAAHPIGSVEDDEDLQVPKRLGQSALDRADDEPRSPGTRDDDCDPRSGAGLGAHSQNRALSRARRSRALRWRSRRNS